MPRTLVTVPLCASPARGCMTTLTYVARAARNRVGKREVPSAFHREVLGRRCFAARATEPEEARSRTPTMNAAGAAA